MANTTDYELLNELYERLEKLNLKKDLMPKGNNFRAISEAAILEALSPVLLELGIDYNITVLDDKLYFYENAAYPFVATCKVRLDFFSTESKGEVLTFCEAIGMGMDTGDKAYGKAYTYAVKYALLKKFRLLYSDDPDFTEINAVPEKADKKASGKKKSSSKSEPLVSEPMTNYIVGMAEQLEFSKEAFKERFGFYADDSTITMKKARETIDTLKKMIDEDLPF